MLTSRPRRTLDELGIEPSAAVQQLQTAVLRQDETLQAPQEPPKSAAPHEPRHSAEDSAAPMLDEFVVDVTQAARDGKPIRLSVAPTNSNRR